MAAQWEVSGKTCLITGGASGMGAFHVESFLKNGAEHVVFIDVKEEDGKQTYAKLTKTYPGKVTFINCDVSDEICLTKVFDGIIEKFKKLDVIFNNAAICNEALLWRKACEVNVQGLISLTMKGVEHMRKDDGGAGGTIINVSSIAALLTERLCPIYSATKAAVLHFSQCLAADNFYETTGIRIIAVCIGATATNMLAEVKNTVYDKQILENINKKIDKIGVQNPASVAAACMEMYKRGAPGSVWVSDRDEPARDITDQVQAAFKTLAAIGNWGK